MLQKRNEEKLIFFLIASLKALISCLLYFFLHNILRNLFLTLLVFFSSSIGIEVNSYNIVCVCSSKKWEYENALHWVTHHMLKKKLKPSSRRRKLVQELSQWLFKKLWEKSLPFENFSFQVENENCVNYFFFPFMYDY